MTDSREQQFHVYLYERIIGRLHRRDNLTRFVFEPDYWNDPERPVLGLRFEEDRKARHRANLRLPPWFSNLLPEGRLREWIARAEHISIDREKDLLAQVGHDLPGAIRVLPAPDLAPVDMSGGEASPPTPENGPASLWRFSLAGVGLKFSLLARGDRLVIPAIGDGGDWILKLPDPGFPDLAYIEGPEAMALRFGGSKLFEAVRLSAFARLDERLGARAELATVAETVTAQVREEWPRAAACLADRPDLCGKIERFVKARTAQLLH